MRQDGLTGVDAADTRPIAPLIDFERQLVLRGHHSDSSMRHSLLQVDLGYGLTSRITLSASIPLLSDRLHEQFDLKSNLGISHNLHGPSEEIFDSTYLSSTPTPHGARGIGDLQLGATFSAFSNSEKSLVFRVGVKAPSGDYKVRDSFGSVDRPDLQPGSGSWDEVGAIQYQHRLGDSTWSAFGGAWGRLTGSNDINYRFGNELSLAAGVTRATPGRLRLSMQVGFRVNARDSFVSEPVPATGLRAWTLTPGARMRLGASLGAYIFAKLPISTHVNDAQLRPRVDILTGFSRTF
jgi:hypothetical protein